MEAAASILHAGSWLLAFIEALLIHGANNRLTEHIYDDQVIS